MHICVLFHVIYFSYYYIILTYPWTGSPVHSAIFEKFSHLFGACLQPWLQQPQLGNQRLDANVRFINLQATHSIDKGICCAMLRYTVVEAQSVTWL